MSTTPPNFKEKTFWQRPEGITGIISMILLLGGGAYLLSIIGPALIAGTIAGVKLIGLLAAFGAIVYVLLDGRLRNLIWYMYKSVMRSITGTFVKIDPIGILKSFVEDLEDNLRKMNTQIGNLKGQIRKITTLMQENQSEIDKNLQLASVAKKQNQEDQIILATRKAARLQDTNEKYQVLHTKMEVLYRILDKMHRNSGVLLEDTKDQVKMKEQERSMIRASHSAMKSAMSVISGDPDKRAMFDLALENIADDVAMKVGEMERFMEMSASVMDSIDLQNGVFQEEGMQMLEKWENESTLLLMEPGARKADTLDLNSRTASPEKQAKSGSGSNYDNLFN